MENGFYGFPKNRTYIKPVPSASHAESASYALTASYAINGGGTSIDTSSFATTGSNQFNGNQSISGSVYFNGHLWHNNTISGSPVINGVNDIITLSTSGSGTSYTYGIGKEDNFMWFGIPQYSPDFGWKFYSSGSTRFTIDGRGDLFGNNIRLSSSIYLNNLPGQKLFGTASWADNTITASYAPNALVTASINSNTITFTKGDGSTFPITVNTGSGTGGSTFPYTGSAIISGSLIVTGSLSTNDGVNVQTITASIISASSGITGSLFGTASWATNALTASYAPNLVISGSISSASFIDFTTDYIIGTNEPAWKQGRLFYDSGSGALAFYNWEQDVTLNIGQEQWLRARNQTGVTITNGSVVKLSGAIGDRPTIVLAQATDQTDVFSTTNDIIGMATHDIEHGTDGFVTTFGLVNGLNTNAFNAGDLIWVSQSAGQVTNVPPSVPFDRTFVGIVTRKNANNGTIFVTPSQPLHFHDISSVSASIYQMGDLWMYRSGSVGQANAWINTKNLTGSYSISGSLTINGGLSTNDGLFTQTITSSFISASSGITGSLFGTASWAQSASQAITASYILQAVSASFATTALTASFLPIGTYAITASWAQSASQAVTASYVLQAVSASFLISSSFSTNIGDGVNTSYTVTHNLNTRNTHITVYSASGTYETVYPDIQRPTVNTATIIFANAPATNQYTVYISV